MRKILITLVVICSAHVFSQPLENREDRSPLLNGLSHGLGAGGTVFDTWGFIYRRHCDNNFGFSTSLGGWFRERYGHIGNELGLLYSFANHELGWKSLRNSSMRVYGVVYLANIFRRDHNNDSWEFGLGAGPGLEFFFNRHFAIHVELPWMTFIRAAYSRLSFKSSHPHFGGGLIYYL